MANQLLCGIAVLLFFYLLSEAVSACSDPSPMVVKQVNETEGQGYVLFTMSSSAGSTSWSLTVSEPSQYSTQLRSYLQLRQNGIQWDVALQKPLDLEGIYRDLNHVVTSLTVKLECTDQSVRIPYTRIIIVNPVSETPPYFTPPKPVFNVPEDSEVGRTIIDLRTVVADDDIRGMRDESDVKQFIQTPYTGNQKTGDGVFAVTSTGAVRLLKDVDYEAGDRGFFINVTAQDTGGLSTWDIVQINITNVNDNAPSFVFSGCQIHCEEMEYKATVDPEITGPMTSLSPGPIYATDPDLDEVNYYIISGSPANYSKYIAIDHKTGVPSLSRSLLDYNISHFSLVIEARDVSSLSFSGRSGEMTHTAAASFLILVSGRDVKFPAVPTRSVTGSVTYNEDAVFISVIILSILLFIALIVVFVLVYLLRRKNSKAFKPTLKGQKSKSKFEVNMRPVDRGSEKVLMRSLSNGTYDNRGFHAGEDDVFVTDIATYYELQGALPLASSNPTFPPPELVPFHETLPLQDDISIALRASTDTLNNRSSRRNQDDLPSSDIHETQLKQIDASMLQSQYTALDLLTSVTPYNDPTAALVKDNDVKNHRHADKNQSLREVDVISELESIVADHRNSMRKAESESKRSHRDDSRNKGAEASSPHDDLQQHEEGVTSFAYGQRSEHEIVPYEEKITTFGKPDEALGMGGGLFRFDQTPRSGNPFSKEIKQQRLNEAYQNRSYENHSEMLSMTPGLSSVYPMKECRTTQQHEEGVKNTNKAKRSSGNSNSAQFMANQGISSNFDENGKLTICF